MNVDLLIKQQATVLFLRNYIVKNKNANMCNAYVM